MGCCHPYRSVEGPRHGKCDAMRNKDHGFGMNWSVPIKHHPGAFCKGPRKPTDGCRQKKDEPLPASGQQEEGRAAAGSFPQCGGLMCAYPTRKSLAVIAERLLA